MSYTYASFVTALGQWCRLSDTNTDFQAALPTIIDQAEQRVYRALNLLATVIRNQSTNMQVDTREFTLPSNTGRAVVLESINVLNGSSRTPLTKISREVMDALYPSAASVDSQIPRFYAMLTDQVILLGPSPGVVLPLECIFTIRPTPLSSSNQTTFLSLYLPDLLFAAAMISATGFQQNWGRQADDPKMGMSWTQYYESILPDAMGEETRRKFQAFASVGGK